MWYLFAGIGFLPGGSDRQTCVYKRRNNTQNNTKTQNGKQTYILNKETNLERILKNIGRVIKNNKEKQFIMRQRSAQTAYCTDSVLRRYRTAQTVYCTGTVLHRQCTAQTVYCTDSVLHRQRTTRITYCTEHTYSYITINQWWTHFTKCLHITSHHFTSLPCTSLHFTLHFSLPSSFGRFVTTLQKPFTSHL
jgi:hypothetical protein